MSEIVNLIAEARRAAFEHRYADAAGRASEALERLPTCLLALRILGWAQVELGEYAALDTFAACTEFDPEDPLAHVGRAIGYQQRGEDRAATDEWVQAWELDPHNQPIRRGLVKLTGELPESDFADAKSLLRRGHEEEAAEALGRLYARRRDPAVALTLMTALWASGSAGAALEVAMNVLTRNPRSIKAALYVAALEDRAGRTLRSREAIARAEQADPGLTLFGDVVRQLGLQAALDLHRATRTPLAAAR